MTGYTLPTTTEPRDQPTTTPIVPGLASTTSDQSPQAANLLIPTGGAALYVFSQEYPLIWNGQLLQFRPGVGYELDAPLLTYLNGVSAPITAV